SCAAWARFPRVSAGVWGAVHILRYPSANARPGSTAAGGRRRIAAGVEENRLRMALLRTRARRRDGAVRDQPPRRERRGDAPSDGTEPRPPIVELRAATGVYPG